MIFEGKIIAWEERLDLIKIEVASCCVFSNCFCYHSPGDVCACWSSFIRFPDRVGRVGFRVLVLRWFDYVWS